MDEIRDIRDIAVTITAVLLIISMVHWECGKYGEGLYLGIPISNDNAEDKYKGLSVRGCSYSCSCDAPKGIDVWHRNSCVNGYNFRN